MSERHGAGYGLSEHELSEIRMLIEERTGIHFDESRERFFSTRVREHLRERGFSRGVELLRAVRKTNIEYEALLERLLTQETSFFRYPAVFDAFEKRVLPELHAKKFWKDPRTLRVWSAGCSTGEEPYSIANFTQMNLASPVYVGRMDLVFCMNVLIYFSEERRREVVQRFFEVLEPGGYLFLGHSESLSKMPVNFQAIVLGDCILYRKPTAEELHKLELVTEGRA